MSLWGNVDNAANSTIFAAAQVNKTPNTAIRASLFSNTTADAFITNATVGQFGVDTTETASGTGTTHAGWVLRTVGSGGRAGRVFQETLVAMGSMSSDGEDTAYPDYRIIINTQPSNSSANSGNAITFSVLASSVPSGATLTYEWQRTYGAVDWETVPNSGIFSNVDTSILSVSNNATLTGNTFRVIVGEDGSDPVTSSNATVTIT